MRKIVLILPLLFLFVSCSVSRRNAVSSELLKSGGPIAQNGFSVRNLTNNNFFIERADIEISTQDGIQNVIATVKYELSGVYLISIRSKTGIEAARILITKDSVLVNDRINRELLYGSTDILSDKYGVEYSLIQLIFGDIVVGGTVFLNNSDCIKGFEKITENVSGKRVQYLLDCKTGLLSETTVQSDRPESQVIFTFKNFLKSVSGVYPSVIYMEYPERQLRIKARIKKINSDFDGHIEFIPGSKYERRELL